ncbi:MAG: PASTA domain-containing protein, partial [Lachnospiraceae bacterium]|nr:PASTA domain-containing protein [Lachnospiraceae bacterium]
ISPEQARGGQVDERSDIYSFGIVYYEMVTGTLPFDGDSTVSIALKHIQENVPPVSELINNAPTSIVRIIEKCTQKKPERRYQKMSSLLADLKTALISPNEDFVVLEPEATENATIMMSARDAQRLREEGTQANQRRIVRQQNADEYETFDEFDDAYDDDDYDEYDSYEDEYDDYDEYDDDAYDDYDEYDDDDDFIDYEDYDKKKPGKKEKDPARKKMDKIILICGIAVGIIILVVLGVVGAKALKGGCGGSGKRQQSELIEMINVKDMNFVDAKAKLEDLGFTNVEAEYVTSETVEKGKVIKQNEAEGSRIAADTKIVLQVSSGKEVLALDDYVGKTQTEAQSALKEMGIQSKITTRYSDQVETGKVIETNPAAGSQISKDTVVELIVSRGPEVKNATVPNLIGSTEAEAKTALQDLKLIAQVEYRETSSAADYGRVVQQSHAAGSTVAEDTTITIVIGVEPQTEPPTEQPPTEPTEPPSGEEPGGDEPGGDEPGGDEP